MTGTDNATGFQQGVISGLTEDFVHIATTSTTEVVLPRNQEIYAVSSYNRETPERKPRKGRSAPAYLNKGCVSPVQERVAAAKSSKAKRKLFEPSAPSKKRSRKRQCVADLDQEKTLVPFLVNR